MINKFVRIFPSGQMYISESKRLDALFNLYRYFLSDNINYFKIVGVDNNDYAILVEFKTKQRNLYYLTPPLIEYKKAEREVENDE